MNLLQDIKQEFAQLSALEKIIIVNVLIFIAYVLLTLPGASSSFQMFFDSFGLPSNFSAFIKQPWSLLTYAFLHFGFWHLFFNMLWLFVLGRFFSNVFDYKLGLKIYFFGVLLGALFFLLIYNLFPHLLHSTKLVGASAGIRALLIFLCAYMPMMDMQFLVFRIKLWHIGVFVVLMDVLGLFSTNVGGNIAHFGGTLTGYLYALQLKQGNTMGKGFDTALVNIESLFKRTKKTKLKTVHKGSKKVAGYTKEEFQEFNTQKRVDLILDKISKSGYDSLTKEEKEFLFKAGK